MAGTMTSTTSTSPSAGGRTLVVLMRHFEAENNLRDASGELQLNTVDAVLSHAGKVQATMIPSVYPSLWSSVEKMGGRVWSSPLRRTIQTSILGMPGLDSHKDKITFSPDLQEWKLYLCNKGSERAELEAQFPGYDFSLLYDGWNERTEKDVDEISERALRVRQALREKAQSLTVLVSHGGFLMHLLESKGVHGEIEKLGDSPDWFGNGEARLYSMVGGAEAPSFTRASEEEELAILGGRYRPEAFGTTDTGRDRISK